VLPEGFVCWEDLLAEASPGEPADQAMGGPMFYTSGTTGFPKGVRSSLSATGAPSGVLELISHTFTDMLGLPAGGTTLLVGPAYHSAQWVFSVFPLLRGSTVVMRHRFDAAEALELIDRYEVTNLHLVPTQMIRMLQLPDQRRSAFDGSSLVVAFHGAAPCPQWAKRAMLDWWGPVLSEYYGGTEGGFLTMIGGEEWLEHPGSLGRAAPNMELQVLDDDGAECAEGTAGQIWFRSQLGTDFEYHRDADKTAAAHRDGWGTLGDVGYLDPDGYLYISDRRIDMIISGGVNIYPAEIEAVLNDHDAVADVAVFGVPDEDMGESVAAAVELTPGFEESEWLRKELVARCREHLAGYKAPRLIEFHDALPRTGTGKLLKRQLREPHWPSTGRSI
jgi:long-chain acyl-CoA synthetase